MTLSLIFTHKTDLKEASSFTVLGGDVVVCGRAGRGPWAYYTYSKQYNESHAPKHMIKVMIAVADPRVSQMGALTLGSTPAYYLDKFLPKTEGSGGCASLAPT